MLDSTRVLCCMLVILPTAELCSLDAKNSAQMQDHYKKVAEGLIGVRKEHPVSQPKIYAMLDQLDKLYSLAKQVSQKKQTFKKKMLEKVAENAALKQEITGLKGDVSSIKKSVQNAKNELASKLAEEKIRSERLSLERKELLDKVAMMEAERKEHENKVVAKEEDKDIDKAGLEVQST